MWLDYDLETKQHVEFFYITNMIPLFTLSYNKETYDPTQNVLSYLQQENIISLDNNSNYDFNYNGRLNRYRI